MALFRQFLRFQFLEVSFWNGVNRAPQVSVITSESIFNRCNSLVACIISGSRMKPYACCKSGLSLGKIFTPVCAKCTFLNTMLPICSCVAANSFLLSCSCAWARWRGRQQQKSTRPPKYYAFETRSKIWRR